MAPANPEHEDTHVINPVPASFRPDDDDDAKTREYVRPSFARPAPWTTAEPPRSKSARRRSSKHTITKTVPALRHMVGMPVMPSFAPAGFAAPPGPVSTPAPSVKLPRARRHASRQRARITAIAFAVTAVVLVGALFGLAPTANSGSVLVTAYGASGLPNVGFKVLANGDTLCEEVPCRFELEPGEHWVTVVAPGYERPGSRRVFVSERSESSLHFELVPGVE